MDMASNSEIDDYALDEPAAKQILYEAYSRAPPHLILSPEKVEIDEKPSCEGGPSIIHRGRLLHNNGTYSDIAVKRLRPCARERRLNAKAGNHWSLVHS